MRVLTVFLSTLALVTTVAAPARARPAATIPDVVFHRADFATGTGEGTTAA